MLVLPEAHTLCNQLSSICLSTPVLSLSLSNSTILRPLLPCNSCRPWLELNFRSSTLFQPLRPCLIPCLSQSLCQVAASVSQSGLGRASMVIIN